MSEVEKLYENAEVKKQIPNVCSSNELYCKECTVHIENVIPYCKNAEYPPFTAEKQLELIKWLIKTNITEDRMLNYDENTKKYYYIIFHREELTESELFNFDEALAGLINDLWQDLTDEDKMCIKNILESGAQE